MFDQYGPANYTNLFDEYEEAYTDLTVVAGARVDLNLVDTTARTGYSIIDVKPRTPQEMAVEYYNFDWEYAQTPEVGLSLILANLGVTDGLIAAIIVDRFFLGQALVMVLVLSDLLTVGFRETTTPMTSILEASLRTTSFAPTRVVSRRSYRMQPTHSLTQTRCYSTRWFKRSPTLERA